MRGASGAPLHVQRCEDSRAHPRAPLINSARRLRANDVDVVIGVVDLVALRPHEVLARHAYPDRRGVAVEAAARPRRLSIAQTRHTNPRRQPPGFIRMMPMWSNALCTSWHSCPTKFSHAMQTSTVVA